ncbi:MAG: hypothetical protein L7S70_02095 [Pseudomonadales bacterium]|nr:hypothetical protein [Pseudomonadales bacterium]
MLAELAAANAAFAIIKKTVQNSGDIVRAGKAIGDLMSAKEELQRRGNQKRARGVGGNDLQEFLALEEIKQREADIKQLLIISGRPGLWREYQKFCEEAKDGRAKAKAQAIKRRKKTIEQIGNAGVAIIIIGGLIGLVAWALWMKGALAQTQNDLTVCRLVKCMKIDKDTTACVYRGAHNTQETLMFSPREFRPREYLCQWNVDSPPPPDIYETLKGIRDSQN